MNMYVLRRWKRTKKLGGWREATESSQQRRGDPDIKAKDLS